MDMEFASLIVSTEIKDEFFVDGGFDLEVIQSPTHNEVDPAEILGFERCVQEIHSQVSKLEDKVKEVEIFSANKDNMHQANTSSKCSLIAKDKVKEKNSVASTSTENHQLLQEASQRETSAAKRMAELICQFSAIFRQITQHQWAWPFMQPVDVAGLGLRDYYKIIQKPMDFGTIKKKLDGNGYNNVRDISADVRLVFKNAMKYNKERDDVHVMAKTLMQKFEEKWLQLLPKVDEEEKRRADEEAKVQMDLQLEQEAANANLARELSNELYDIDMQLEKLREMVVEKCKKMSPEEKKKLGTVILQLPVDDIFKALEIVAEHNPGFQPLAEEVNVDMAVQNDVALWRLRVHVQKVLKGVPAGSIDVDNNVACPKRKIEACDDLTMSASKRSKKAVPFYS